jgi:hypothetical protein
MLFVCISQKIAIIPLHTIKQLFFITVTVCVKCAVGTENLNIIQVALRTGFDPRSM